MKHRSLLLATAALATATWAALSAPALAATAKDTQQAETNAKLENLERAVGDLNAQLQQLKSAQSAADSSAAWIGGQSRNHWWYCGLAQL